MTPGAFFDLARAFPEPMLLLDRRGRVLESTPACRSARLVDGNPKERLLHELVEESEEDVERYLRDCRATAQPTPGALTFRGPQGQTVRCRTRGTTLRPPRGEFATRILLRLTPRGSGASDNFAAVTDQVQKLNKELRAKHEAMVALASREKRLRHLIDTTQDAVVFIDRDHNIVLFNPAAEKIFEYTVEEVIGRPVTVLMSEPHASKHEGYIHRYEETGEGHAIGRIRELTARRKSGEEFPIELSVAPGFEGEDIRYAAFVRDISERNRLRSQLLDNERLAAIGTTSAKFAHEVANPLNGMYMHAQLLNRRFEKADDPVDPRVVRSVQVIRDEIQRLIRLLKEFRDMSARQTFRFENTSLREILRECGELREAEHEASNIKLVDELGDDPAAVRADRDKLKQAVLNLYKNAAEAMPGGGILRVRLSNHAEAVRVEIADNGCGIPKGVDVFKPFTTTKQDGTGLGLPVVQQMLAAHGGSIRYESTPQVGTSFFVELPRAES